MSLLKKLRLPRIKINHALWAIYIALLIVLLPHTKWAFSFWEPDNRLGNITAIAGAFTFEAAIWAFTTLLSKHNREMNQEWGRFYKFRYQFFNAYSIPLYISLVVSALANFSHAEEFRQTMVVFNRYNLPPVLFSIAFGGILPVVSLLFALALSTVSEGSSEVDKELRAKADAIMDLQKDLARVRERNQRLREDGEFLASLSAESKRERIEAVMERALRPLWSVGPPYPIMLSPP